MHIPDERLWWERTLNRLNIPERERLLALLNEAERLEAVRQAWAQMSDHQRRLAPKALKEAMQ